MESYQINGTTWIRTNHAHYHNKRWFASAISLDGETATTLTWDYNHNSKINEDNVYDVITETDLGLWLTPRVATDADYKHHEEQVTATPSATATSILFDHFGE